MPRASHSLKRFTRDPKGTIAIAYAMAAVPLILAMGSAIDFVRFNHHLTQLQGALDSAALSAAAGKGTDAHRIKLAEETLDSVIGGSELSKLGVIRRFEIKDTMVLATASAKMPTAFMQLGGIKDMDIVTRSEVSAPETKKAEIALVLDYSGSMKDSIGGGVKYEGMRDAAKKLISDLEATAPDKVKFGLVPFSHHVYTTLPSDYVLGQTGGGSWTGCTQDRRYPYNLSDATPSIADGATRWGQSQAPEHKDSDCRGYAPNKLVVRPLTNDFASLKSQLDAMRPYAWTHIALGVEFGQHVLSPNAPYTGGVAYKDKGTQKVMVVLTDGMQTEPAFGPGARTVAQGETNLERLCANAKANDIRMMTIAYDLDDTSTRARLRDCATDPAKDFFIANDTAGVASAFDEIRRVVTAQMFLSK